MLAFIAFMILLVLCPPIAIIVLLLWIAAKIFHVSLNTAAGAVRIAVKKDW